MTSKVKEPTYENNMVTLTAFYRDSKFPDTNVLLKILKA